MVSVVCVLLISFNIEFSLLEFRSEDQIAKMEKGGNNRLKAYFAEYDIAGITPMDLKFRTRAAEYYRMMLAKEVSGEEVPEKLSVETGREVMEEQKRETIDLGSNGITSSQPEDNSIQGNALRAFGFMSSAMKNAIIFTKEKAVSAGNKIHETVTDPNFKQNVIDGAKRAKDKTVEVSKEIADKTVEIGKKTYDVSKDVAHKGVEYGQKGLEYTKTVGVMILKTPRLLTG